MKRSDCNKDPRRAQQRAVTDIGRPALRQATALLVGEPDDRTIARAFRLIDVAVVHGHASANDVRGALGPDSWRTVANWTKRGYPEELPQIYEAGDALDLVSGGDE